jgi:autotransporter-associated beta strand protein
MKMKKRMITGLILCAGLALVPIAQAADGTWDGDTSTVFTNVNNWVGGILPSGTGAGNLATFGASLTTYQPSLTSARSVYGLNFQKLDGGWTLGGSGQTLTIGAAGITNLATSGTTTIDPNLIIGGQTWYNNGGDLTVNGTVSINNNTTLTTVGSGISTIASLNADTTARTFTKSGAGTLAITGAAGANLQGTTTLSGGTLILGNKSALGTGLLKLGTSAADTTLKASTDLSGVNAIANNVEWVGQLAGKNVFSGSQNITLSGNMNGPASGTKVSIGNNLDSGKKLIFSGNLAMYNAGTAGTVTYAVSGAGETEFSGNLSDGLTSLKYGALQIDNTGAGITTLSGSNTYSGATTINSGVLRLSSANALSANSALTISGVLGLGSGDFTRELASAPTAGQAKLTGNGGFAAYGADRKVNFGGAGATQTWNSVGFMINPSAFVLGADTADKTVTLENPISLGTASAATRTIQVNNGSAAIDAILSGVISGGTNGLALVKTGAGTLKLTGKSTYKGATTVSGGMLFVDADMSAATGAVTVDSGAALGGSGIIGGATTVNGTLSPGNSPGTLTFNAALGLGAASTSQFEIVSLSSFDVLAGNGANTITFTDGATIVFDTTGYTVNVGDSFLVLSNWSGRVGTLANINFVGTDLGGGKSLDTSKFLSQGLLTVIPEPATVSMLGLGALITLALRRKLFA